MGNMDVTAEQRAALAVLAYEAYEGADPIEFPALQGLPPFTTWDELDALTQRAWIRASQAVCNVLRRDPRIAPLDAQPAATDAALAEELAGIEVHAGMAGQRVREWYYPLGKAKALEVALADELELIDSVEKLLAHAAALQRQLAEAQARLAAYDAPY